MTSDDLENPITLAVLAGGEGRRMGRAKGNLVVHGKPILQFLLDQWQWKGPTLLVTAPGREHPQGWKLFDREAVDPAPGQGPLRGILTSLQACETPILIVATVDMPGVESGHLRWVADQLLNRPESLGVLLSRTRDDGTQIEPFPSVFRASALKWIEAQYAAGERSVHRLGARPEVEVIAAPSEWPHDVWANLNIPADIERFLRQ